jgi:hypothetical protein
MTTPAVPVRQPGFLETLLWGTAFVVLVDASILAVNAAMMPYGGGGGLFGGWMLSLILIFVCCGLVAKGLGGEGAGLFLGVIIFAVIALVFQVLGGRIYKLGRVRETPVIAVAEADQPAHASCDVFHFSDGKVLRKYYGLRELPGRRRHIYYYVAPLVPEGWKDTDPVTAWVASEEYGIGMPFSWDQPHRGGYRTGLDSTDFRELVDKTAANRRLVSRPNAPILEWDAQPREALESAARAELWGMLAVDALVLGAFLFPFFRRKPRRT